MLQLDLARTRQVSRLARARKGITLVESLIAMLVAAIGLFGVFVLISFCAQQAQLGKDYDAAAQVAKSAADHFAIAGMNNPNEWVGVTLPITSSVVTSPVVNGTDTTPADGIPDWKQRPYCIDPLGVLHFGQGNTFPDVSMPGKMQRISLTSSTTPAEARALFDLHFRSRDGVIFESPDDKTLLPIKQIFEDDLGADLATATDGSISWMAMIEPHLGHEESDVWRINIVVFKQRVPKNVKPEIEKTYEVNFGTDLGIGGGDVILTAPPDEKFRLHRNSWVMLQSNTTGMFRWYRVSSADEDPTVTAGNVNTNVTLHGPDWFHVNTAVDPDPPNYVPDAATAIFIPEVILVYEKTMRLDSNSSWSMR